MRYLLYEYLAEPSRQSKAAEKLGPLFYGVTVAVDRLARNERLDVEKFIADEINRSWFEHRREAARAIMPPASTLCDRRRRGDDDEYGIRQLLSYEPADGAQDNEAIMQIDFDDDFYRTDEERDVAEMLATGYSYREIAATLATTKYRVESIVATLRRRAIDRGMVDE